MGIKLMDIDGEHFVEYDTYQFYLKKSTNKTNKENEPIFDNEGSFITIQGLLKKYISLGIKNSNVKDAKELIQLIKDLDKRIEDINYTLEDAKGR